MNAQDESPMIAEHAIDNWGCPQDIGDTPPIVISRYGNRVIEWRDINALNTILAQLRQERTTDNNASDTARLLQTAELIKQAATQHILTSDAPS
jgi:hypothetical protein